jgi:16S rRNA (guanine527-N7)-methyltransferase
VFLKGPNCDDEIDEAKRLCADDWSAGFQRTYGIPGTTHRRRLLVYERRDNPRELRRRAPREVDSAANPSFRQWKSLLQAKGVKDERLMLLAGARTVPEALRDLPHACVELLVPRGTADVPPETPPGLPVNVIGKELFRELDVFGTGRPLLVLRAPDIARWDGEIHGLTLAVPFQDPENVGAVLRSAAAFGVETVVLLQEAAHPGHPKALRSGGTAALRLGLRRGPKLSDIARLCRGPIVALSADGTPLDRLEWPEACLIVPGLEGPGLPEVLRAQAVAIPMADGAESLNAATAVAVALYAWAAGGGKRVAGVQG